MTYEVEVTIWCDETDCEADIRYLTRNRGGLTKTAAATYARLSDGWHIPGKNDPKRAFCPKHRKDKP